MKIFWTDYAKCQLKEIFNYYNLVSTTKTASSIMDKIMSRPEILLTNKYAGPEEELLSDRKQNFRHLLIDNYKVIYWVNSAKNRIEISDVFDVRQNPIKMSRSKNDK